MEVLVGISVFTGRVVCVIVGDGVLVGEGVSVGVAGVIVGMMVFITGDCDGSCAIVGKRATASSGL